MVLKYEYAKVEQKKMGAVTALLQNVLANVDEERFANKKVRQYEYDQVGLRGWDQQPGAAAAKFVGVDRLEKQPENEFRENIVLNFVAKNNTPTSARHTNFFGENT